MTRDRDRDRVRDRDRDRDIGAGSVLVLAVLATAMAVMVAISLLGQVVLARHRAESAADLAALAAADVVVGRVAGTPCAAAARIASANAARLLECTVGADGSVRVRAGTSAGGVAGNLGLATGTARAGQPP